MIENNADGFFTTTPATNLLYGLREAVAMLMDEGLANVFARHSAVRRSDAPRRRRRGGSRSCARIRRNTVLR